MKKILFIFILTINLANSGSEEAKECAERANTGFILKNKSKQKIMIMFTKASNQTKPVILNPRASITMPISYYKTFQIFEYNNAVGPNISEILLLSDYPYVVIEEPNA
ncbi:MAG: hypothetical protein P4L22_04320 [Candidatus Babeliales bacterium]|nr:hypothetical protein [Candidatus Babeliales bacterium]